MGFLDDAKKKLGDAVDKHGDKISEGLDKAGDLIDKKTGGKYSDKISDRRRQGQGCARRPRRPTRRHPRRQHPGPGRPTRPVAPDRPDGPSDPDGADRAEPSRLPRPGRWAGGDPNPVPTDPSPVPPEPGADPAEDAGRRQARDRSARVSDEPRSSQDPARSPSPRMDAPPDDGPGGPADWSSATRTTYPPATPDQPRSAQVEEQHVPDEIEEPEELDEEEKDVDPGDEPRLRPDPVSGVRVGGRARMGRTVSSLTRISGRAVESST